MAEFGREAEIGIIGSILIDNGAVAPARDVLKAEDFYSEANRAIYSAMLSLADDSMPINAATIAMRIGDSRAFGEAGGVQFLLECERRLPSACNVPRFAEIVRADSLRRKIVAFGQRLEAVGQSPMENPDACIATLGDELIALADGNRAARSVTLSESMGRVCSAIVNGEKKRFVRSGFTDLDALMNGFYSGSLSIVAARPAMGKTAFGLCIASNVAITANVPVLFYSVEMQADDLATRIISMRAAVDGNSLRRETVGAEEMGRMLDAVRDIGNAPMRIVDTANNIAVIRDHAKRESRVRPVGMIIVDYLQLVRCTERNIGNREQEIAAVSRALKELAKDLSIPVIALAQLSRAVESRADKRPILSDLRESGSLEQDADNVIFIHREDYYTHGNTNEAEIIIAKQRSGPTGIVKLHWDGRYTRFSNLRNEYYD